jgi:hypothetical protein
MIRTTMSEIVRMMRPRFVKRRRRLYVFCVLSGSLILKSKHYLYRFSRAYLKTFSVMVVRIISVIGMRFSHLCYLAQIIDGDGGQQYCINLRGEWQ